MAHRLLKTLEFECSTRECPTFASKQCVPSLVYNETESDRTADVLFVGLIPAGSDADKKRFCTTQGSIILNKLTNMIGAPLGGVGFTALVRCRPKDPDGGARDAVGSELECCQKHLLADLAEIKPKILVFEGLDALRAVHPTGRLLYNKVTTVELGGVKYTALAIISPRDFVQTTSLLTHVADGLSRAFDLAERGEDSFHHPKQWQVNPELVYCDTVEKVGEMVEYLLHGTTAKQSCAFDVETKNLNARYGNSLVTLQFCVDPKVRAWVVPYHYQHSPFLDDELLQVKILMKRLFTEKPNFRYWLTHNGIFEQLQVMQFITDGNTFSNAPLFDTLNMAYNMDENRVTLSNVASQGMALKVLTPEFVGRESYDEAVLAEREKGELYKLTPERLVPYAADDVINTQLIFRYMRAAARATGYWEDLEKLTAHIGGGAYRTFAKLKRNGMFTDIAQLRALSSKTNSPILTRMADIKRIAASLPSGIETNARLANKLSGGQVPIFGTPQIFQFDKPEHYKTLLFDTLGIKPVFARNSDKKTEAPAVDKNFYDVYADAYPEVKLLQEYTGMKKLATSYTASVMGFVDPSSPHIDHNTDCRVRPDFGFTNTVTGRPSCVAKGTLIKTVGNARYPTEVPIEDIKVGDVVYCFDDGKRAVTKPVTAAWKTGNREVCRVVFVRFVSMSEGHIDLTPEHQVRLTNGSYKEAGKLVVGDCLLTASNSAYPFAVDSRVVQVQRDLPAVDVYDLTIQDVPNFIANEINVHNCHGPSIHNVPRADNPTKQEVKSMYCAEQSYGAWKPGKPVERVLMQLDFMAAEVRIWGVLSGDKKLAKAIYDGKMSRMEYKKNPTPENKKRAEIEGDIHRQTASQMFGVPIDQVTKGLRQNTKAIVFALLYGGGPSLIAARLKKDNIEEVKEMCRDFSRSFPIGNKWLNDIEHFARENYYVASPIGRRRRLMEFMTGINEAEGQAKRLARNAPIQGFASDACILAASFWNDWIEKNGKDWKIVNIVHDSCVTEIPITDIEEATAEAEKCFTVKLMNEMTRIWGVEFICPLEVEFDFGVRWGHMKKWDGLKKSLPDLIAWLQKGGTSDDH